LIEKILHEKALIFLTQREHSRHELEKKLTKFSEDVDILQQVLNALVQQDLLSDARFTEQYIRMRARRGFGPQRIEQELKQRGISSELIEQYLDQGDIDWYEKTQSTWQKKFKKMPKEYQERMKQMRFLQYRGFTTEQIQMLFANETFR
jgi:regulatory protein